MSFFDSEARKQIKAYKYACIDSSPFSRYVMHPFWNTVVKIFPMWVAPNLMTFVGFLIAVLHYVLLSYFNFTMLKPETTPLYIYVVCAVMLFVSHTLDGVDGKQARRTASSSALGEIFDHGCDAVVATLLPCSVMCIAGGMITPQQMFHMQVLSSFGFAYSHWEKYITDVLYLPWVFDVSQVTFSVTFLVIGLELVPIPSNNATQIIVWLILGVFWLLHIPISMYRCLIYMQKREDIQLSHYVTPLFDTAVVIGAGYAWVYLSGSRVLVKNPRVFLLLFGIVQANICLRVMALQLGRRPIPLFSPMALLYLATIGAETFLSRTTLKSYWPDSDLYLVMSVTATVVLYHVTFSRHLVQEFCHILHIKALSIKSSKN